MSTKSKADHKSIRRASSEEVELGLSFLNDYFAEIKAKVQISVKKNDDDSEETIFELNGDIKPLKRNPQMLSSLARLTSMAMSSQSKNFLRCSLDLEGKLSARRTLLEVIAEDAAAVAKHTHKRAIIEGLSSNERRRVHNFVSRDEDVETLSDGEGEFRYMMVAIKT